MIWLIWNLDQKARIRKMSFFNLVCLINNCFGTRIQSEPFLSPGSDNMKQTCPPASVILSDLDLLNWFWEACTWIRSFWHRSSFKYFHSLGNFDYNNVGNKTSNNNSFLFYSAVNGSKTHKAFTNKYLFSSWRINKTLREFTYSVAMTVDSLKRQKQIFWTSKCF